MIKGPVVTACVAVFGMGAVLYAFISNASPYMSFAQALRTSDDHVHIAGDLLKDSISNDMTHHTLRFKIKDTDGTVVQIVHHGEMPANLGEATKVVAIGGAHGNQFDSEKLLVKCPSKYEAQDNGSGGATARS